MPTRDALVEIIQAGRLTPLFQPIVDLFSGEIYGYEIFTRGSAPFENPREMFDRAREWGLSFELDCACRKKGLVKVASLSDTFKNRKFFLNTDPHIFTDAHFEKGHTRSQLKELGLEQRQIVLEISETAPVEDYPQFEKMIRHYFDQGFAIALDNFGAGQKGLVTLVAASPNFVKLDYALVSGVQERSYKQHLVKSVLSFASNVESTVIAEGVETQGELETLIRLGVRYGQGFLLGRPAEEPGELEPVVSSLLRGAFQHCRYPRVHNEYSIVHILMMPPTIEAESVSCREMDRLFREDSGIDHFVIVKNNQPMGILTRQSFYTALGGPTQSGEFEELKVDVIAKSDPLCVNERLELDALGQLAMTRSRQDVYDPVIVMDDANQFMGTITMKQLLYNFINFEVRAAVERNPLTNLPGNRAIEKWLGEILDRPPFTIIYADLDRFKEFNDVYGFSQGDQIIKLAAQVLTQAFSDSAQTRMIGHIGGDDFVIICDSILPDALHERACRAFDEGKRTFFAGEDAERGYYLAQNRKGDQERVPLVTISLAVLTSDNIRGHISLDEVAHVAASLKKRIKKINAEKNASGFLHDRRKYY